MKNKKIVFISAQPDVPYFHWQVEVLINNFIEKGINPNHIEILFSFKSPLGPSNEVKLLAAKYPFVRFFFYENTIENDKGYIPILRPHVLKKHFFNYPELSTHAIFYHDSDILFRQKPDFDSLLMDDTWYVSDTVSYIGAKYIQSKGDSILSSMCDIINLHSTEIPIQYESSSGGAQYLMKYVNHKFWEKVEKNVLELWQYFSDYEEKERITLNKEQLRSYNPIQKWCSDMWAVLWNAWYFQHQTAISSELSFSWATSPISEYEKHNIYHNAGVVDSQKKTYFYKGEYINQCPFGVDFSYVDTNNCSSKYVEAINKVPYVRN